MIIFIIALSHFKRSLLLKTNASNSFISNSNFNFAFDMKRKLCQKKKHLNIKRFVRFQKTRCNVIYENFKKNKNLNVMIINKKDILLIKKFMIIKI